MKISEIAIDEIRTDGGTQARAEIDADKVSEYREAMEDGCDFPPVVIFNDGSDNWLVDGFHRFFAAKRAGFKKLKCDCRQGTKRDAILFAVGCNGTHGIPRTNDDKRTAVMILLEDDEWKQWSNYDIARQCAVSEHLVRSLRPSRSEVKFKDKHGNESVMNTANIGKRGGELLDSGHSIDPNRPAFQCACGEVFDAPVWHCQKCHHHWPKERTECWNCHGTRKEIGSRTLSPKMDGTSVAEYIRTLSHEINEDDEPESPKSSKQYINGDTGEEIDNLVTVTTKETKTGRGVRIAYEAINVLKTIPPNDPLRDDGLQIVERWIKEAK